MDKDMKANKIIAVDFDGTLCENNWPEIGEPKKEVITYLKERQAAGDKLILWTCRVGEMLEKAVKWCIEQALKFDAVNENLPEVIKDFGSDTRKIFANEYIDDRNAWLPLEKMADILYLCDGKQCGDYDSYWEKENKRGHMNEDMSQSDRMELWGSLIDVVEDWLSEKGITADDIPNDEREDTEDAAIIFGNDYDYLANQFSKVIGISRDIIEDAVSVDITASDTKPNMPSWAEREIEIACAHENPNRKPGEWDYGCACYESALKAYNSLLEDGHSIFTIGMTKHILNRLIEGKPLTPIEDTDDVWNDISRFCGGNDPYKSYQCKRMGSLFKYVYDDGRVEYKDVDRFCCYNNSEDGASYHSGLVDKVMYEKFPITMPYYPRDAIKVVCEDYLTDSKNGDFDTVGILYVIKPDGERVEINRYFKEGGDDFIEIAFCEYEMRRKMHYERLENLEKDCHGYFGAASDDCGHCMEE